ncbi:MAG: hypothetical protein LH472_05520 [Pyrinomonadaceae bacterium]|nr:hypothetical protein [Pyrinomonadaceae bacterium]
MKSKVLLFFIDGLGIGERGENNPFSQIERVEPLAYFVNEMPEIIHDGVLIPTDPRQGFKRHYAPNYQFAERIKFYGITQKRPPRNLRLADV